MYRTDDPIADFDRWDSVQTAWLYTRPDCDRCKDPIQDESCYEPKWGYTICKECFDTEYGKKWAGYGELRCDECGEEIDFQYYHIDKENLCPSCADERYGKDTL